MRYAINFDKTVNQLVPHYLGGRKLILFIQAVLKPIQAINDVWKEWAAETRIEAAMTSQVIKFEWFLNHKFSKYFLDSNGKITIRTASRIGAELHWENTAASGVQHAVTRFEGESSNLADNMVLYHSEENEAEGNVSFIVSSPDINTAKISQSDYIAMLAYQIDKYKIAGKTYSIKFGE